MTLNEYIKKAINLTDSGLQNEMLGRNLVDKLTDELNRLHTLKLPTETYHVGSPMSPGHPDEYETNYKKVIQAHSEITDILWFLEDERAKFEINMISDDLNKNDKLQLIKKFIDTNELNAHAMFSLGLTIGHHNQEVASSYFTNKGIDVIQKKHLNSMNSYHKNFSVSLKLMRDILHDFYKSESHHPFKPNLVLDQIENLCVLHQIPFPMDRKRPEFKSVFKSIMSGTPKHSSWKGASKKTLSKLNVPVFINKYEHLFIEASKK